MAVSRQEINALYQDLFGRDAQDAGAQYWMGQVESGAIAPETLRDALIQGAQGSDITAYRERGTRLQQQAAEQARLAAEERYRQQQEASEERTRRQMEQQRALAEQARLEQQSQLDMLRQQQEQQNQFFQTLSTGMQGKGGTQQQTAPFYADADPTQTLQGAAIAADGSNVTDFTPYTGDEFVRIGDQVVSRADLQRRGSDYYTRPVQAPPMSQDEPVAEPTTAQQPDYQYGSYNPYASGYGMGYQSPGMAGQYMPRYGMLGPSGFGAYGGYSPYDAYAPSYSPYSPYGGGKGGYAPMYSPYSAPVTQPEAPTTAGETTMVDDTAMAETAPAETASSVLAGESDPNMAPTGYPSKGGYGALPRRRPMPPMYGGKGGYYP